MRTGGGCFAVVGDGGGNAWGEQPGFSDAEERLRWLSASGGPLGRLRAVADFEAFRTELEVALPRADCSRGGRPPWDAVLMFRVLVLQALYTLHAVGRAAEYHCAIGSPSCASRAWRCMTLCPTPRRSGSTASSSHGRPGRDRERGAGVRLQEPPRQRPRQWVHPPLHDHQRRPHDGGPLGAVLDPDNTDSGVWADTAYRSKARLDLLDRRGLKPRVQRAKPCGKPMPAHIARGNATKA